MTATGGKSSCSRLPAVATLALVLSMSQMPMAFGVVKFFDGFGDADLNNNGTPLEHVDVNVQGSLADTTYVPGRLAGGETPPENNELTSVLNPSEQGIRWLNIRGFTSGNDSSGFPGSGESKPTMRIVDDGQGVMQETKANGVEGGLGVTAIDSGYALSWESRGGGSVAAGFFNNTIELGPEVGDEVKVSFDFRIWRDAPNLNGSLPNNVPDFGELRFGLFQDTDNQLGQVNPYAGRQVDGEGNPLPTGTFAPATWGVDEGLFEGLNSKPDRSGSEIGTNGDNGWQASVFMGNAIVANGGGSRIREEVQSDRILQGSDVQTIAQPQNLNPDPFGNPIYDFVNLDLSKVYNIALSLTRDTYVGDSGSYSTILSSLIITDKATQQTWTLSGMEDDFEVAEPVFGGGIQSDSWDYFALRNASSSNGEFDFILDNFTVELFGSNAQEETGDFDGDGDVDGRDFLRWQRGGSPNPFSASDLALWQDEYGGGPLGAIAAVPEPSAFVLSLVALASLMFKSRG
jgi:hypothetical protein